jgi:hypothetical protein
MKNYTRKFLALPLILVLIFQAACGGPLSKLDNILDYAPIAITLAVNHNRISAEMGEVLKDDISSGRQVAKETKARLSAADTQLERYQAYVWGANEVRKIIARNHFAQANDPIIAEIAEVLQAIMDILVAQNAPDNLRSGPVSSDDELDEKLNKLDELLKKL